MAANLKKMMETPGLVVPPFSDITDDFIDESFDKAVKHLETLASFVFKNPRHKTWSLGTWSKNTSISVIQKYGTAEEIAKLPRGTRKQTQGTQTRKRKPSNQDSRRRRQRKSNRNAFVGGVLPPSETELAAQQQQMETTRRDNNLAAAEEDANGEVTGISDAVAIDALMQL